MDEAVFFGYLARIAVALEKLANHGEPVEPNYVRPLEDFAGFDWSSIGASVVNADQYGPTHLECDNKVWTRRSPQNKFGEAIWFSCSAGKDDEGETKYMRLITFRKINLNADPLPAGVAATVGGQKSQPARQAPAPMPEPPVEDEEDPAAYFEKRGPLPPPPMPDQPELTGKMSYESAGMTVFTLQPKTRTGLTGKTMAEVAKEAPEIVKWMVEQYAPTTDDGRLMKAAAEVLWERRPAVSA